MPTTATATLAPTTTDTCNDMLRRVLTTAPDGDTAIRQQLAVALWRIETLESQLAAALQAPPGRRLSHMASLMYGWIIVRLG